MSMKPSVLVVALVLAGYAANQDATAAPTTLLIERVAAAQGVNLPTRGQLMPQVEAKFGAPTSKHAPVGGGSAQTPPITRWIYPTFSVYFENDHVISAVLNKANPNEIGPQPVK